ncbi:unnamed protein product [Bursaphelenchus okinawaensis]|uniref:Cytoplasmic FMR1-interacting protein n=1 Tax=Bursaphelenchus okinawaensis TaxID=465554 RepID=A0A811KYI3_9BILA|nr:unnamed protein product [Bursaphelenchus okinawaensis]CAG9114273.1 unnamed protein product [Bursaphelenchus okinawaensis]
MDKITLNEAFEVVQALDDTPVYDDQPTIEANSAQVHVQARFDTNFQDREAFVTGVSKYIEEATRHGDFNNMLAEGFRHAGNLYTWRCISRAVPSVQSNDDPDRNPINQRVCQVLGPQIDRLFEFMEFANKAIELFCNEIARLCHPEKRKDFVSESYLLTLGKFLNMLVVLDELKNMKASIKNDMSTFKRATQALQGMEMMSYQKVHDLSLFLAMQHRIKESLKERLVQIEGYEEVLADVVNICSFFFEHQIFVVPDEKHMFVKVIAISLFLIDGAGDNVKKLDHAKRISIQKLDKLLKTLEVVPLFGDMQIQPFSFVKRSQFYNASKWPLCNTLSSACHVNLLEKVKTTRKHHDEFMTHLAKIKNDLTIVDPDQPRTDEGNKEITDLCLNGLRLLCDWTSTVIEVVSWKLDNPAKPETNENCPPEAASYAKATTYNYSLEEKAAVVEMIAMIKGVQMQLGRLESAASTSIRKHIYAELQDFVQVTLREPLHKAVKHKKDMVATIINSIIDTCGDASNLTMSKSMEFGKKKTKKEQSQSTIDLSTKRRREVPPSSTQLYLTRTMLESLVSEKSGGRKLRKDIDNKHVEKMLQFLRQSYYWSALLEYSATMEKCCDMSQFWFREFYLEMSMGEQIQFPIEMSIPWILTDHILTTQDPSLMECLLYQLDLYNDAANYSLKMFRKQHLYDEVEAEVNLCFDQFVFKLSEAVFQHYKQLAATMLLDKGFKSDCTRLGIAVRTPLTARYETLLKQRHVQLLGRSIDLNRLISQRINVAIARSLDVSISRFESEGLWYIVALDAMIETNRLCHRLLSEHLHSLNAFEDMLTEANHQVNSTNGRTTLHIFNELTGDLIPNFTYNAFTQRFVKGRQIIFKNEPRRDRAPAVPPVFEFGSKSLNAAFANNCAMHKDYIGQLHFTTMAKLMGYQGIATVIDELLHVARKILDEQIKPHVRVLYSLSPKSHKLPRYDYGAEAVLQYYLQPARPLVSYEPLKKEFGQGLREFGNLLAFCNQLESGLGREDMFDLFMSAPFTSNIPKPPCKSEDDLKFRLLQLSEQANRLNIASAVEVNGNTVQKELVPETELLTKERLCGGMNIFERVLTKVRDLLNDELFVGPKTPQNGVMYVDEMAEFHRLWSNVQIALHVLQIQNAAEKNKDVLTIDEIYGDSLHWAAMAIIRTLNQHKRFDVMDFSYHLLRVSKVEGSIQIQNNKDEGVTLSAMVDRIRRQQTINNYILSILGSHLNVADAEYKVSNLKEFEVPKHPRADEIRKLLPLAKGPNRNITGSVNTSSINIYGH